MKMQNPVTRIGASLVVTVLLILATYLLLPKDRSVGSPPRPATNAADAKTRADQKRVRMAMGQLPLSFEMNRGQFDPEVQFASRSGGFKAFFTKAEAVFLLRKPNAEPEANANGSAPKPVAAKAKVPARTPLAPKAVVRMSLAGGNPDPTVTGVEELPGKINYFRGNDERKWVTDVPTYQKVSYGSVYPGIDLVYYGKGRQLEYDLVIAPGADPSRIGFNFDGAERLEVDAATGALVVTAAGGAQMRQGKPLIYQEVNGMKRAVTGGFTANGNRAG